MHRRTGGSAARTRQSSAHQRRAGARRPRRWLCRKHKKGGKGIHRYPDEYLHRQMGLVRLTVTTRDLPWAKA